MTSDLRARLLKSDLRELIAPDLIADPYPAYEALRGAPVRMRSGTAVVTSYADGSTVLRDETFVRETMPPLPGRTMRTMANMLIVLNPPEHTRLREAATPLVATEAMAAVERHARTFTEAALSEGRARGGLDVVADLAQPLAMSVICDVLGIEDEDRMEAQDWSFRLNQAIDTPVPLRATRAREIPAILRHQQVGPRTLMAMRRAVRYANDVIEQGHDQGDASLVPSLRELVAAKTITIREAASIWMQVLVAGFDTVQTMLTTTIWLLSEHPDQYELLVAEPGWSPGPSRSRSDSSHRPASSDASSAETRPSQDSTSMKGTTSSSSSARRTATPTPSPTPTASTSPAPESASTSPSGTASTSASAHNSPAPRPPAPYAPSSTCSAVLHLAPTMPSGGARTSSEASTGSICDSETDD